MAETPREHSPGGKSTASDESSRAGLPEIPSIHSCLSLEELTVKPDVIYTTGVVLNGTRFTPELLAGTSVANGCGQF